jgi:hypothetical protein
MSRLLGFCLPIFLIINALIAALQGFAQPFRFLPPVVDFGSAADTGELRQPLALLNEGRDSLQIAGTAFWAARPGLASFRVSGPGAQALGPGDTLRFEVRFQPAAHRGACQAAFVVSLSDGQQLAAALAGRGLYTDAYYLPLQDLAGDSLRKALQGRLAAPYQTYSYNESRDLLFLQVDNQPRGSWNLLRCGYTGDTLGGFASRAEAQKRGYNTEHVFPQSLFDERLPMKTDLHHLYAVRESANGARGSLPFGEVDCPDWQQGGSVRGGGRFEPREDFKGRIARAMLYFVARYGDYEGFWAGQAPVLLSWHRQFPPDSAERQRNGRVQALQGNRNPFVDWPGLAEELFGPPPACPSMSGDSLRFPAGKRRSAVYCLCNPGPLPLRIESISLGRGLRAEMLEGLREIAPGQLLPLSVRGRLRGQTEMRIRLSSPGGEEERQVLLLGEDM